MALETLSLFDVGTLLMVGWCFKVAFDEIMSPKPDFYVCHEGPLLDQSNTEGKNV